jgi:hypothetical protein
MAVDGGGFAHGFVRSTQGIFTIFDPVGCGGTYSTGIETSGTICGLFLGAGSAFYGFMLQRRQHHHH